MNRIAQTILHLTSALLLAGLLAIMPIALLMVVGWPGPTALPDTEAIESVLSGRRPVPALFLTKALAVAAWVIWVQLVFSTIAEIRAARVGLLAQRASFIPGLQRFVAWAVLAITLLMNSFRPAGAAPAPPVEVAISQPFEVTQATQEATPTPPTVPQYTTKPGDSWWGLAQTHLGDGSRFGEIRSLNIGKQFDGFTISEHSDYLGVGWQIDMPSGVELPTEVTVEKGDTVAAIAADHDVTLEQITALNGLENPNLIHPGDQLQLPNVQSSSVQNSPAPTKPPPTKAASAELTPGAGQIVGTAKETSQSPNRVSAAGSAAPGSPAQSPAATSTDVTEKADSDDPSDTGGQRSLIGGLLVGAGLLGSGLYGVRRRRVQELVRDFDTVTGTAAGTGLAIEPATTPTLPEHLTNKVAAAASYDDADLLESVLQLVGQRMGQTSTDPGIVAAVIGDNAAEVIFARKPNIEPGPLFTKTDRPGWRATRPESLDNLKRLASFSPVPCPATVSLGSVDTASLVAINLEEVGGLNLVGSDDDVRSVMFNMVVELATTRLADTIRIVAVGFGHSLPKLERVEQYDEVPSDLQPSSFVGRPALQRLVEVDPIEPIVAISVNPQDAPALAVPGVIPITANATGLDLWEVSVEGRHLSCAKLGLSDIEQPRLSNEEVRKYLEPLPPQNLPRKDQTVTSHYPVAASAEMAAETAGTASNPVLTSVRTAEITSPSTLTSVGDEGPHGPSGLSAAPTPSEGDEGNFAPAMPAQLGFDYVVSVLGPIECGGISLLDPAKPWKLRKVPELLCLLATSERGRTSDSLKELLWPGEDPAKCGRRLNNVVSESRRVVVGDERLPKVQPGTTLYRLESVGTDLMLFEENIRRARAAISEEREMQYYSVALGLVRGRPFDVDGTTSSEYGWAEAAEYAATVQIISVACRLASWHLEAGRFVEAGDAAEVGLLVSPDHYELANLFGMASLADSDEERRLKALMTIRAIQNQFQSLPEQAEVVLPESLRKTEAALRDRVDVRSA